MNVEKNDEHWFNEIFRIEKECPKINRVVPPTLLLGSDELSEEQVDDYFMISDRTAYKNFVKKHENELSHDSFLWLFEDIPAFVDEKYRKEA